MKKRVYTISHIKWHALTPEETLDKLQTSIRGLSDIEIVFRRKLYGANELPLIKRVGLFKRFFRQFNNILIYILLIGALVTLILGRFVDSSVIIAVLLINAIFGCIQEGKAQAAIRAIRQILASTTHVLRNGKVEKIPANLLVPGDLVFIQSGDKVPADLRLVTANNLQVQEAALTGESLPVTKSPENILVTTPLAERTSMAYSGTFVTHGRGSGIVIGIGADTEVGRISKILAQTPGIVTPLIRQMNAFGRWLTLAILVLAGIIFSIGLFYWHEPITRLFVAIVGIIVAAIPEGLPAIMTVILAIGVIRMAKHNAIVRRLPSVETMGAVTTICTDKTGTLTRNELSVRHATTSKSIYNVSIDGYTSISAFSVNDKKIDLAEHQDLITAIRVALLCNDAVLTQNEAGQWILHGDPLDGAIWSLAVKAHIDINVEQKTFPRTDMIPFEPQHKMMATLHHDHIGNAFIHVKGAPEQILQLCDRQLTDGINEPLNVNYWQGKINHLAKKGERIIAVAMRSTSINHRDLRFNDIRGNFIFLGLFGLIDPERPESKFAVARCQSAGISVKMITGDHAVTAANIAAQVGIKNPHQVLTGKDIETLSLKELKKKVNKVNVYARTSPENKLRLVEALQASGNIVAMTGDGVNDAPALKQADIGIAMGKNGTEVAKEASAMVLADDNFATIAYAVEAGRTIYDSLKKAILYILPTSIAQSLAISLAIVFGEILPISTVQILWINMITTITLSLALAFEPAESDIMLKPPRPVNEPILSPLLGWRTIFVSLLITVAVFILFYSEKNLTGEALRVIRTVIVNMIVAGEVVYLFNCRKIYTSSLNKETLFGSKPALVASLAVILLQMAFTYIPFMQTIFGTAAISMVHWGYIVILALIIFGIVEGEKYIIRLKSRIAL